jgi:hypothetical protein
LEYDSFEHVLCKLRCGIVALAMAMNINSCNTTVEKVFEKAKELLLTIQGELFDGKENLNFHTIEVKLYEF